MSVDYRYIASRFHAGIGAGGRPRSLSILPLGELSNPLLNFYSTFVKDLQSIKATEIAQSQPYISIVSLDQHGKVLTDFNKEFFLSPIAFSEMRGENRYADRPKLSLKSVKLSADLAAGGGFTTWQKAIIEIVIHKPDVIGSSALSQLLFTGTSLRLTYGWNSLNESLDTKKIVLLNVSSYNISYNTQGEAHLTLEGLTQNALLGNYFVGDTATEVKNSEGLAEREQEEKVYVTQVDTLRLRPTAQGQRNAKVVETMTVKYKQLLERASQQVQKNFKDQYAQLQAKRKNNKTWFSDVEKKSDTGGLIAGSSYVTVHDIISTLCGKTLDALGTTVLKGREFRIVYGTFNSSAGIFASTSIADFPIHWNTFEAKIKDDKEAGRTVPTLQSIFHLLLSVFLSNQFYWDNFKRKGEKDDVDYPKVVLSTSNFLNKAPPNEVVQLGLVDINLDVPITQKKILDKNQTFMSQAEQEQFVVGDSDIPIIKLGHANSFIKNINISHQNDEYIKAYLINRISTTSLTSARQPFLQLNPTPDQATQALQLPLRGDMDMLGNVNWLPGRFFYLSTGIFFLDGVYSVLTVEQNLDSTGFRTRITFMMH